MLLALAAKLKMHIDQMDIKTAFLNAELHVKLFVLLPKNCGRSHGSYKLGRSLYGLKQSPVNWFECLASKLVNMGFATLASSQNIYRKGMGYSLVIVAVYVDDLLVVMTRRGYQTLKRKLETRFKLLILAR
jgi:hypothetical protein